MPGNASLCPAAIRQWKVTGLICDQENRRLALQLELVMEVEHQLTCVGQRAVKNVLEASRLLSVRDDT